MRGIEESQDQKRESYLTLRNRQMGKHRLLIDRNAYLESIWPSGSGSKSIPGSLHDFFFTFSKSIKILDILALPFFVICTKVHIVEKAIVSYLCVIAKACGPQK